MTAIWLSTMWALRGVAMACALSIGGCAVNPADPAANMTAGAMGGAAVGCAMGALATVWAGPVAAAGCAAGAVAGAASGAGFGLAATPPSPIPYYYPGWP
jgi:hypothetical protein